MTYPIHRILLSLLCVILAGGCERAVGTDGDDLPCVEQDEIDCLARPDCLAEYEGSTFLECNPLPQSDCTPSLTITSGADLVSALAAVAQVPWPLANTWASGRFLLTTDLEVTTTLTVDASDFAALHPGCNQRYPGFCEPLRFKLASDAIDANIPGVTFSGEEWSYVMTDPTISDASSTMTIDAGTTVRLSVMVYTRGNDTPFHLIELFPRCPESCSTDTVRCPFDQRCYAPGDTYCRRCHGGSESTCACQGADGTEADTTDCSYQTTPEFVYSGTCEEGVCVAESPW